MGNRARILATALAVVTAACADSAETTGPASAGAGDAGVGASPEVRSTWAPHLACAPGLTPCGTECVDLDTDVRHCGGCGASCAHGARCVDGGCVPADCDPVLQIRKTASVATVRAGDPLAFTIVVTNIGWDDAIDVTMSDALAAGFSWSIVSADGSCRIDHGVLRCEHGTLRPGDSSAVRISTPTSRENCGEVINTAQARAAGFGPELDSACSGDVEATALAVITCPQVCPAVGAVPALAALSGYLFVFADGSIDANWQGATKGFAGDVAVDGVSARERTSGGVPYAGTIHTNDTTLGAWQRIVDQNVGQAFAATGRGALLASLEHDLTAAFAFIDGLAASPPPGFDGSPTSLHGLSTQNSIAETFVLDVTTGMHVDTQIRISGDPEDVFILRWDADADPSNGYQGQVKLQSGGAIVPGGGLRPSNFVHVAGDLNASGGGRNPPPPYPQGPGIPNGRDWSGGGFFTGYWLTTGDERRETAPFSNAIFVGGWYTTTTKLSMTSGTSGVHVPCE